MDLYTLQATRRCYSPHVGRNLTNIRFLELLCHVLGTNIVEISSSGRLGLSQTRFIHFTIILLIAQRLCLCLCLCLSYNTRVRMPQLLMRMSELQRPKKVTVTVTL
jgi:hypothetical protein